MKKAGLSILLLVLMATVNAAPHNSAAYRQKQIITASVKSTSSSFIQDPHTTVTYQTFYDELSPYGK